MTSHRSLDIARRGTENCANRRQIFFPLKQSRPPNRQTMSVRVRHARRRAETLQTPKSVAQNGSRCNDHQEVLVSHAAMQSSIPGKNFWFRHS
jgi:hypothetical protein